LKLEFARQLIRLAASAARNALDMPVGTPWPGFTPRAVAVAGAQGGPVPVCLAAYLAVFC